MTAAFLLVCSFAACVTALVTDPPVENGGTVTVAAPENTPNVTILCEVTDANNMTIGTTWIHVTPTRQQIFAGNPLFETLPFPFANLTIRSFVQSLDETTLECSNKVAPLQMVFFALKIISKTIITSVLKYIIYNYLWLYSCDRTSSTHEIVYPSDSCGGSSILIYCYCSNTRISSPAIISVVP